MITIEELKNMLADLKAKEEKLYNENSGNFSKGFLAGQINLINYLLNITNESEEG